MIGSELSRVELLRRVFGGAQAADVLVGIGDDAAVLRAPDEPLVWTIDAAVEGVHFRRDLVSFQDLGYRATMAAASDLAAMGAVPLGLLSALVLPGDVDDDALEALARGQREAADALGTAIVGGNLARGAELSITTTALGRAPEPIGRGGARAGDVVWLAGPVGLAGAGFALLDRRLPVTSEAARAAVLAFRRPVARIAAGVAARASARAAIDISDGLARDLGHVARAGGVRVVLDPEAIVTPELAAAAAELGVDPVFLALHGGEDYALAVVAPSRAMLPGFTRIGGCEPLVPGGGDVALVAPDGSTRGVSERGFDHFATG